MQPALAALRPSANHLISLVIWKSDNTCLVSPKNFSLQAPYVQLPPAPGR